MGVKEWLATSLAERRVIESRGGRVIDFFFADFMADPKEALADLYDDCGLVYDDATKEAFGEYLSEQRGHKRFKYTLEQYGLDANEVAEQFAAYYDRFQTKREV